MSKKRLRVTFTEQEMDLLGEIARRNATSTTYFIEKVIKQILKEEQDGRNEHQKSVFK